MPPDSESIDVGRVTTVGLTVDERIEVARELVRAFWAETPSEVAEDALTRAELRLNIALPHALREGYRRLLASTPDPYAANAEVEKLQLGQLESNFRQVDVEAFAYWPDPTIGCRFLGDVGTIITDHAGAWLWAASLSSTALSRVTELITADWTID